MQEISTVKLHAITRIILGRYRLRNVALALVARCPLLAQSGHAGRAPQCPLLGVKRTQSAVAEHTFKISHKISEGGCAPWAVEFWRPPQVSYGPFKTFKSNFVSNSEGGFLFLHFPFKDLTQNQECYWPNSDPKSQPLSVSLLQSRP
jgi:hypothetical protein